jgi:hypothetical protein
MNLLNLVDLVNLVNLRWGNDALALFEEALPNSVRSGPYCQ